MIFRVVRQVVLWNLFLLATILPMQAMPDGLYNAHDWTIQTPWGSVGFVENRLIVGYSPTNYVNGKWQDSTPKPTIRWSAYFQVGDSLQKTPRCRR